MIQTSNKRLMIITILNPAKTIKHVTQSLLNQQLVMMAV